MVLVILLHSRIIHDTTVFFIPLHHLVPILRRVRNRSKSLLVRFTHGNSTIDLLFFLRLTLSDPLLVKYVSFVSCDSGLYTHTL